MQKGAISVHNHTSTAGDGGQLSNMSVSGTLTTTGIINEGTATPTAAGDVTPYSFAMLLSLLTGGL